MPIEVWILAIVGVLALLGLLIGYFVSDPGDDDEWEWHYREQR